MKLLLRRTGVAVTLLAGLLLCAPAAAQADQGHLLIDVPGDEQGFVQDTSSPVLDDLRLAPGYSTSGDVALRNTSKNDAHLVLRAVDLRDDDNDCNRPESREGDTTCGPGGGELGSWLRVTVSRLEGDATRPLWTGTMDQLAQGADLREQLAAGGTAHLRVGLELPYAATNETQTDRIGFALRWSAAAHPGQGEGPGPAQVLGVEAFAPGGSSGGPTLGGGPGVTLPFTGVRVGWPLLLADSMLLTTGGALLLRARRRRFAAPCEPAATT